MDRKLHPAGSLLLAGWALYVTVVTASNLTELLWSFRWENWAFRSGNLAYIAAATRIWFHDEQANQALLAVVIAWGAAAAALLWLAALRWARGSEAAPACARHGLVLLGLLWLGFAISTELLVAYDRGVDESAYWTLAAALLATVAVLEIWASAAVPAARRAGHGGRAGRADGAELSASPLISRPRCRVPRD